MIGSPSRNIEVLVVGAGPTGLVLALWLTRLGVRVRIVDATAEAGTTSRAVAVQARTLELYGQLGLAGAVVARGRKAVAANLWVAGRRAARFAIGDMGAGLSPFPFALSFPQDEHERLLIDRLADLGVEIERRTKLLGFAEEGGRVLARLQRADAEPEACQAAYIAGCDGAHSTVREALGIGFPGGTYSHLFYVADVAASGAAMNGELHVALDATDFLAVFPLQGDGHARLVGTVRDTAQELPQHLAWTDVSRRVIEWMHIDVARVNWFSTYRVHHRVVDRFRQGRAFLAGDAAHIHSPVGGQGMNTGIGDAANLAWKLAAVLRGQAPAAILDSYEPERIAFARRLVATTDRVFAGVTSSGVVARRLRLNLVPRLVPLLFRSAALRRLMFRTVSQTAVSYRGSSLSAGRVGPVHGGDRLPWIEGAAAGGGDNYAPLVALDWQVHVYGDPAREVRALCEARGLPLHVFPWRARTGRTGLRRDAVYLVRPDGYVALVAAAAAAEALASYHDSWQLASSSPEQERRPRPLSRPPARRP